MPPLEIHSGGAIFACVGGFDCRPMDFTGELTMNGLLRYQSPLDRVLGAFLAPENGSAGASGGVIDLDVVETPEAYVVKAELPGVAKDKIEVNVDDRDVTIAVEFREELEANGKMLWRERSFGKASRAIRLPEAVDASAAQARHSDGVLQLTLPKIVKATSKQITIQ
jgi:HSP20 family protein